MNEKNEEEPKQKNEINNINPEEEKVAEKNTQTNNDINNQKNEENEIFLGKTILYKYRIEKKIRRGSQAQIYLGENIRTFEQYAIKVEKNKEENCLLKNEIYMLGNLQNSNSPKNNGIVEMYSCANYKGYLILVEKLLGKSYIISRFIQKIHLIRYMPNSYSMFIKNRIRSFQGYNSL